MSLPSEETEIFLCNKVEISEDIEKRKCTSPNGSKKWEYLIILACTLLNLCVGMETGWNSPAIALLLSPDSKISVTMSDISTITASMSFGHSLSPLINMFILDKIGRKYSVLLCSLPLLGSWSLIMIGKSVIVLIVARVLSGISLGCTFMVTPIYLGEISSVKTRGANGTLIGIACNLGLVISYIIVPCMPIETSAGVNFFLSICFVILFLFMPESPYYLAMRGRTEEAEDILVKLRGKINVSEELTMIVEFVNKDRMNKAKLWSTFKDIFTIRQHLRSFFIGFLFTVSIYFSGFIIIIAYGQFIFNETLGPISAYIVNIITGIALLLSPIITFFFIDKLGRKPLILPAGIIVGLCSFIIGSYFFAKDYLNINVSSFFFVPYLAPILVFTVNLGFSSVWGAVSSEIFAIEVKVLSSCMIYMLAALFAVIINKLYMFIAITLNCGHSVPFFGFSLITWVSTVLLFFFIPETKGKTFNEIQGILQSKKCNQF